MAERGPPEHRALLGEHARRLDLFLHELKTPLTSILLSASALLTGGAARDRRRGRRAVRRIVQSARAMHYVVADLLDVAAIDHGRLRLERRIVALAPIIDAAFEVSGPLALDRGVRLVREAEAIHASAWSDRARVLQVVLNLVSNAIKFAPEGGTVMVRAVNDAEHAEISVHDDGPGIPAEVAGRLFQPFASSGGSSHGHGLGLYLSRCIAEALGGSISLDASPVPGRGTTFRLALPAH